MQGFTLQAPRSTGNRVANFLLGLGMSLGIGFLDAITGSDISFFVFYLIPVFFVAWTNGLVAGIVISVLDLLIWVSVNLIWPLQVHFNHELLLAFSVSEKVIFICLFLIIIVQLRQALVREQTRARIDEQTGLGNSHALMESLEQYLQNKVGRFALACFDLEGMDSMYLREGKPAVDKVFRISSLILKRRVHRCFRIQDDSFVAILEEPQAEEAKVKTRNLRDLMQTDLQTHHGYAVSVDACVVFVENPSDPHRTLERMHECLRRTKVEAGTEPLLDYV